MAYGGGKSKCKLKKSKSVARQSYGMVSDVQSKDAESKDVESAEGVDDVCVYVGLQVERQCPSHAPQSQYDHHHVLGQHEGSHSGQWS